MFDPAVAGTLLIGLDRVRSDARQTHPRRDAARASGQEAARSTHRRQIGSGRGNSVVRRLGTLVASLLPQRASYETHQRR